MCTAPAEPVFLGRQESTQLPPHTASTHTCTDPGKFHFIPNPLVLGSALADQG